MVVAAAAFFVMDMGVGMVVAAITLFFLFGEDGGIHFQQGDIIVFADFELAFYHKAVVLSVIIGKFIGFNGFFFHYFCYVFFCHNRTPYLLHFKKFMDLCGVAPL